MNPLIFLRIFIHLFIKFLLSVIFISLTHIYSLFLLFCNSSSFIVLLNEPLDISPFLHSSLHSVLLCSIFISKFYPFILLAILSFIESIHSFFSRFPLSVTSSFSSCLYFLFLNLHPYSSHFFSLTPIHSFFLRFFFILSLLPLVFFLPF